MASCPLRVEENGSNVMQVHSAAASNGCRDDAEVSSGHRAIPGQIPIKFRELFGVRFQLNSVFHENMEQNWILTFIFTISLKKHRPSLNGWQVFTLCGERSARKVLADRKAAQVTP